jgi:hypothetical protein
MQTVSDEIERRTVIGELRVCSKCAYQRGFHVSFIAHGVADSYRLVLICPNCGARYSVGVLRLEPEEGR